MCTPKDDLNAATAAKAPLKPSSMPTTTTTTTAPTAPTNLMVTNHKTTDLPKVVKGNADWREYHSVQLENGVTCVFVNDKESKTTACSVCVGVGASSDPRELSGLAHFTEHMCFLGSDAYPVENEFKSYLSSHGGRSNASTSMSQTVYKFDILADHAEKAIDIFSNFFISPLFSISGTSREINAVDSENSKNMSNDARRRLQILKALANPNHHYSKFSTGNAKTLDISSDNNDNTDDDGDCKIENECKDSFVREAMIAFHKRHYRPDNLTVVIIGPQSLQTLQEWTVPRFATIMNRWEEGKDTNDMTKAEQIIDSVANDAPIEIFGSPSVPYDPAFDTKFQSNAWPILLTTSPLQSIRKLFMYFPLPSVKEFQDQSPYNIICHLFGHEGPGSIFAQLQDAGLIDAISVGPKLSDIDQSLLQVTIALTEKGEEQWEDVVSTVFDYCSLLHDTLNEAKNTQGKTEVKSNQAMKQMTRIWDEIQRICSLRFHQTSPGQAYALAPSLAGSVRKNGTTRCMAAGSMINENVDTVPIDNLLDFINRLVPQNCFVEHCSQSAWKKQQDIEESIEEKTETSNLFGFHTEKWYGVDYHLSAIDNDFVERWNWKNDQRKNLHLYLPAQNQYIPTDLSLCEDLPEDAIKGPRIEKDIDPPNLVVDDKIFGRLWHRLDDRYCLPKASLTILFRNTAAQHDWDSNSGEWYFDTLTGIQTSLLGDMFYDALAQTTYDAELAGIRWSFAKTASGLELKCNGYSQHLTAFASNILEQFFNKEASFIQEKHLRTNKDRMVRYLKSYLTSKRADTYAGYYAALLLTAQGMGVEKSLELTNEISIESLAIHHEELISSGCSKVECLISGNISQIDAQLFFDKARGIVTEVKACSTKEENLAQRDEEIKFIPGPFERALAKGEDIRLHFQSLNPEEQNGAVRMKFQSLIPGFKGFDASTSHGLESMSHSAAIRVLCHMLREPLFNQLRTKEQLGYIVNSHFDIDIASNYYSPNGSDRKVFTTTPINSIVVNVLSRKVSPLVLTQRIDEFLESFRDVLVNLPEEEVLSHTDSLSRKFLKPIQKLESEVIEHFSKIRRYGPEILDQAEINDNTSTLPWNSNRDLAAAIKEVKQTDLLEAWDSIMQTRLVSHVYGNSFKKDSLLARKAPYTSKFGRRVIHIDSSMDIIQKRSTLQSFGRSSCHTSYFKSIVSQLGRKNFAIASVAVGTGILLTMNAMLGAKQGSELKTTQYTHQTKK